MTISAYLKKYGCKIRAENEQRYLETAGNLLGELNIVEDNERALYVEDGTVVDAGSDVVVTHSSFDVGN